MSDGCVFRPTLCVCPHPGHSPEEYATAEMMEEMMHDAGSAEESVDGDVLERMSELFAGAIERGRVLMMRPQEIGVLLNEVGRLRECLHLAGLACLMRDRKPEEVAAHLHEISASWGRLEARHNELVRAARKAVGNLPEGCDAHSRLCEALSEEPA